MPANLWKNCFFCSEILPESVWFYQGQGIYTEQESTKIPVFWQLFLRTMCGGHGIGNIPYLKASY